MKFLYFLYFLPVSVLPLLWEVAAKQGPDPRYVSNLVDTPRGLVLFGGKNDVSDGFDDTWIWDGKRWAFIGHRATKRWDHSVVYHKSMGGLFLFGGRHFEIANDSKVRADLNDNWIIREGQSTRLQIPSPPKRSSHAMAYEEVDDRVILFGGRSRDTIYGDTWIFENMSWRQLPGPGPGERFGHTLIYDKKKNTSILFAGHNGHSMLDDMWIFEDNRWTEVKSSVHPSARMAHAMASCDDGKLYLFGGYTDDSRFSDELWVRDKQQWTLTSLEGGPQGRLGHALGWDKSKDELILFGGSAGFGEHFLDDTWRLPLK